MLCLSRLPRRWRVSRCLAVLAFLAGLLPGLATAQTLVYGSVYRPLGLSYQVLMTPHFELIFEPGLEDEARELAFVLEEALPRAETLLGGTVPRRFPVVLNGYNDAGNGFVTPAPFKSEIEGIGIKGNVLGPGRASWVEEVGPHELVHAVQFNRRGYLGLGAALRPFAPDMARVLNLGAPGLAEGAAVFLESTIEPGAGRLNFPLFTMQFRAAMLSDRPWNLSQLVETSAYTWPYNRHYIGGAHLYRHFARQDGGAFYRSTLDWNYAFPFFGFGFSLLMGTGEFPAMLSKRFRHAVRDSLQAEVELLGPLTPVQVIDGERGRFYRRPRWLDDRTLLVHMEGYHDTPGLYRVSVPTGERTRVAALDLAEDAFYSLTPDRRTALAGRYELDGISERKVIADVVEVDLATGRLQAVTQGARVLGPVEAPNGDLWMLQNDGQTNQWVVRDGAGRETVRTNLQRGVIKQIVPPVAGTPPVLLMNVAGYQGLFRIQETADGVRYEPWVLFEEAAVYDAAWSADARYLVFAADPTGIVNLYALDTQRDAVHQLTNVAFAALEPTLSPDGTTLAFVHYEHQQYQLATIPFDPAAASEVPRSRAAFGADIDWTPVLTTPLRTSFDDAPVAPYRALQHLRPRIVYPALRWEVLDDTESDDTDLGFGIGLGLQGADPLQRVSYGVEGFFQDNRLWGNAALQLATTFLRPTLTLYDEPSTRVLCATVDTAGTCTDSRRLGQEERGVRFSISRPYTFGSNVHLTRGGVTLSTELEQVRFFDERGETVTVSQGGAPLPDFATRWSLLPSAFLAVRQQSNPRDLIPNSGLVLQASGVVDLTSEFTVRQAAISRASLYLPVLQGVHAGLRLGAGWLTQNTAGVYDLDTFVPRGYEDVAVPQGDYVRADVEYVQPLWYIDNGFVLVPLYFQALYAYGFGEVMRPAPATTPHDQLTAAGLGLGLRLRAFSLLNLDLRIAASYLVEERTVEIVGR